MGSREPDLSPALKAQWRCLARSRPALYPCLCSVERELLSGRERRVLVAGRARTCYHVSVTPTDRKDVQPSVITGDCLDVLPRLKQKFQLAYLDPPFFTGMRQQSTTRNGTRQYGFEDSWPNLRTYLTFIRERLLAVKKVMQPSGSIVYHCDSRTSHHARTLLDAIWGPDNFRSEIVWTYRRWSNSKRGLMQRHQTLFWYTKSQDYSFNQLFEDYSPATNIDQLLQLRTRDHRNKPIYASDANGNPLPNGTKPGVPLSDVWDIPYLNPNASERVGYPTQKPIALLGRVIELFTEQSDWVLDPFCGSGTTLVSALILKRKALGIDISSDATTLTSKRLANPRISRSRVLENGRDSYRREDTTWSQYLAGLPVTPVHRNRSIDAVLQAGFNGLPVLFRVQRPGESISELQSRMLVAVKKKCAKIGFVVQTCSSREGSLRPTSLVRILQAPAAETERVLATLTATEEEGTPTGSCGHGAES